MELPFTVTAGQTVEELTRQLGIRADIYIEAQRRKVTELRKIGQPGRMLGARRRRIDDVGKVFLNLPKPVYEDIKEICRLRELSLGHFVRACVNTLLLGPDNPRQALSTECRYRGELQVVTHARRRWPFAVDAYVSHGAKIALRRRADAMGTSPTALVRAQIVDVLEGRVQKLHFVTVASMFGDPDKYWTDPKWRKS